VDVVAVVDGVCGEGGGGFCAKTTLVESNTPPAHKPVLINPAIDIDPPTDSFLGRRRAGPTQPDAPTRTPKAVQGGGH